MKGKRRNFLYRSPLILFILFFATYSLFQGINASEAKNIKNQGVNKNIKQILSAEYVEDEIFVKFKEELAADYTAMENASAIAHSKIGAIVKRRFKQLKGLQLVKLPKNKSVREALEYYLKNPQIEYAEPNYIVHATATPDDTYFANLWGLNNTGQTGGTIDADIDAPEAWDLTTGSSSVVIAVVDTGVAYNHPDLSDNIWTNTGETSCIDGIDNDSNGPNAISCFGSSFFKRKPR